jgi:hypothetical protein
LDDLITVRVTKDVYLSTPTKAAKTWDDDDCMTTPTELIIYTSMVLRLLCLAYQFHRNNIIHCLNNTTIISEENNESSLRPTTLKQRR